MKSTKLTFLFLLLLVASIGLAQTKPFPQNIDYPYGFQPKGYDNPKAAAMNYADAKAIYDEFIKVCYTEIEGTNYARIKWDGGGWTGSSESDQRFTASEGIGYGMLLTAYYGDKAKFDKLLNFYNHCIDEKVKRTPETKRIDLLMPWLVDEKGEPCNLNNLGGDGAATDGDIDAAYALLVAEVQWPGNGYLPRGKEIIALLRNSFFEKCPDFYIMAPGDYGGCAKYKEDANDPSYYCAGYFRVFADVMGDPSWNDIANDSYKTLWGAYNYHKDGKKYDFSDVVLCPDFQQLDGSPHKFRNNKYAYDASRVPWRMAIDYIWNGTEDGCYKWTLQAAKWASKQGVEKNGKFVFGMKSNYDIDGRNPAGGEVPTFTGGFTVGAMVLSEKAVTMMSTRLKEMLTDEYPDGYFNLATGSLYSLTLTGNFWKPEIK